MLISAFHYVFLLNREKYAKKQNLEKPDKFFCYIFNENDK